MLEDVVEEVKDVSLAVILKGHGPCVFYSSASMIISINLLRQGNATYVLSSWQNCPFKHPLNSRFLLLHAGWTFAKYMLASAALALRPSNRIDCFIAAWE